MHINGPLQNSGSQPQGQLQRRIDAADSNTGLRASAVGTAQGSDSAQRVSSPEVAKIKQQLQELPEVRLDVVQAVSDRLAAGELSGSKVLLRTAAAMLNS